jgi:4-amino-4-deoxy-L-arabinose transferase-like glycosyltransferase
MERVFTGCLACHKLAVLIWFGPLAGLAAAWLIATSDFHILYSRTALTDVPVAFFILLAVFLYWEAVRRESLRWSIAAGVATGFAWWTKYTGWLPLAIAFAGSIAWLVTERRAADVSLPSRAKNVAGCFATMAVVAFVVWSPVLWYLQPYGGYAAVAENHRGYLRPISEWGSNAIEQASQLAAQTGNLTVAAMAVLGFVVPLLAKRGFLETLILELWCAATIAWSVYELGPAFPLFVVACGGIAIKLVSSLRATRHASSSSAGAPLALWLLAAWLCGMTVTTPFYTPYSRLALPWLMAGILGACVWLWNMADIEPPPLFRMRSVQHFAAVVLFALPAGVFGVRAAQRSVFRPIELTKGWSVPGWQNRNGLKVACESAVEAIEDDRSSDSGAAVVYVYETLHGPATFFHLASHFSSQNVLVVPAGSFAPLLRRSAPEANSYFVTNNRDVWNWSDTLTQKQIRARFGDPNVWIAYQLYTVPSTLVVLDDFDPSVGNWTPLEVLKINSDRD